MFLLSDHVGSGTSRWGAIPAGRLYVKWYVGAYVMGWWRQCLILLSSIHSPDHGDSTVRWCRGFRAEEVIEFTGGLRSNSPPIEINNLFNSIKLHWTNQVRLPKFWDFPSIEFFFRSFYICDILSCNCSTCIKHLDSLQAWELDIYGKEFKPSFLWSSGSTLVSKSLGLLSSFNPSHGPHLTKTSQTWSPAWEKPKRQNEFHLKKFIIRSAW